MALLNSSIIYRMSHRSAGEAVKIIPVFASLESPEGIGDVRSGVPVIAWLCLHTRNVFLIRGRGA